MKSLYTLSRPHFWIYVFWPYLIGSLAGAWSIYHRGFQLFHPLGLLLFTLYFLYPANLLIYGVNDLFDYETDSLNEKKQSYEKTLQPHYHKSTQNHIVLVHIIFLLLLGIWIGWVQTWWHPSVVALLVSLISFWFFGVFYSAKPIRAKAIPFVDWLFNVLYIIPALIGFYANGWLVSDTSWQLFLAGILRAMAMHCYSAVPDIEADKSTGIATAAVVLGKQNALVYCGALYLSAAALSYETLWWLAILGWLIYSVLIILSLTRKNIFWLYRVFPYINTLCGFGLFVRLVFHML